MENGNSAPAERMRWKWQHRGAVVRKFGPKYREPGNGETIFSPPFSVLWAEEIELPEHKTNEGYKLSIWTPLQNSTVLENESNRGTNSSVRVRMAKAPNYHAAKQYWWLIFEVVFIREKQLKTNTDRRKKTRTKKGEFDWPQLIFKGIGAFLQTTCPRRQ